MAGKNILLATEFIRGSATTARLLPLAVALADRGHDVTLAVPPRLQGAAAATGFHVLPAPIWDVPPPPGFLAVSYADLLLLGGYAAPDSLRGLLTGWGDVLDQAAAALLVDFAPTAMLAARVRGLAVAVVGDGYSLPPLTRPMTVMRPWADVRPGAAADTEGRVLAVIGACMAALKGPSLRSLRDLFRDVPTFLCTFAELDHYRQRADALAYYGEVFPHPAARRRNGPTAAASGFMSISIPGIQPWRHWSRCWTGWRCRR